MLYKLKVELYVPSCQGHKLSDVEFLIVSMLWTYTVAAMFTVRWLTLAVFSHQALIHNSF